MWAAGHVRCATICLYLSFELSLLLRRAMPSVPLIGPGEMMLERTPRGPSSTAITALKASTPALAADTCAWKGVPDTNQ